MPQRETIKIDAPLHEWAISHAKVSTNLEFMQKHILGVIKQRRAAHNRVASMNAKVTRALIKEFTRAGIDLTKVDAASRMNAEELDKEITTLKQLIKRQDGK